MTVNHRQRAYSALLLVAVVLVLLRLRKAFYVYPFTNTYMDIHDEKEKGSRSTQHVEFYTNDALWNTSTLPGLEKDLCSGKPEVEWCDTVFKKLRNDGERTIILTQSSCAFIPLTVNLADQVQKYGHDLVVIAEDCGAYNLLKKASVHVCTPLSLKETSNLGDNFDTDGFLEITATRPLYVALGLKHGFHVLWMDSDSSPLADPLGFIGGEMETVLVDGNRNENHYQSDNYCSCFFFVRNTVDNIMWMEEWVNVMAHNYTTKNDQPAYNIAYRNLRRDGKLQRTIVLPRTLYPNGADYPMFKTSSAWIHANRRIGLQAKVGFLRENIELTSRYSQIDALTKEYCVEKTY